MEAIINRDQRTAKTRVFSEVCENENCDTRTINSQNSKNAPKFLNKILCDLWCKRNCLTRNTNFCKRKRRSNALKNFWRILEKLKNVLLLTTCLTFLTFPSSLAAPRTRRMTCNKPSGVPKWVNPCDRQNKTVAERVELDVNFLEAISSTALLALLKTEEAKNKYARQFKSEAEMLNTQIRREMYQGHPNWQWLPTLPIEKSSGEFIERVNKNWDQVLLDLYKYLQTFAVGLEQITSDFEANPVDNMAEVFSMIEGRLKTTLCELYSVLGSHGVHIEDDVSRDVMPDELRCSQGQTFRMNRDWVILTEYVNALVYTRNVLEHLATSTS